VKRVDPKAEVRADLDAKRVETDIAADPKIVIHAIAAAGYAASVA